MKNINKIITIISFLIITVYAVIFLDLNQSRSFSQLDKNFYSKEVFSIKYDEKTTIDSSIINKILQLANEKKLILQKTNYSSSEKNVRNIYISFESTEELYDFMSKQFKINKKASSYAYDSFISTYKKDNENQVGVIKDLLNNDKYNYFIFDKLLYDNGNLYGEYIVYYENYDDFQQFIIEVEKIVNQDISSQLNFNNSEKYVVIIAIISIIIICIFYSVFQIFDTYNSSKKIGCMKLLGFDKNRIAKLLILKSLILYITTIIILNILVILVVKNITLIDLFFIFLVNILVLLLTLMINYISIKIVYINYNICDIIKKKNIASSICSISAKLKVFVTILLISTLSIVFKEVGLMYSELEIYNKSKELINYGIINNFQGDAKEIYEYEKHSELYKNLSKNKKLEVFYANFDQYDLYGNEEREAQIEEDKRLFIRYGSVDKNYLIKEKIDIYDLNGEKIELIDIKGISFIFPRKKIKNSEYFKETYKKQSEEEYKKYNIDDDIKIYIYDDQILNTYRLNLKIKEIDSPILRVIDETLAISYIESPIGINTFGTELTTGLKIRINNNKKETFEILQKDIKKAGLENLIGIDNFLSFSDYFSEYASKSKIITFFALFIIFIIMSVYIVISLQVITLYVKSENRQILVKYFLGHDVSRIFSGIISTNNILLTISALISLFITILLGYFNILFFTIMFIMFLIVDNIISFTVLKTYNFKKIYTSLKGGNL